MKVIAIIITLIGLFITGISSLGIVYPIHTAVEGVKNAETAGIGTFARRIDNARLFGYVNLFGVVILFFGVLLMIAAMFMGKNRQVAA